MNFLLLFDKENKKYTIAVKSPDDTNYPYEILSSDCIFTQKDIDSDFQVIKKFTLDNILNL